MEATLGQLADLTGATVRGDPATPIRNAAGIQHARPGEIALLASRKYGRFLPDTGASALVVPRAFDPELTDLPLLVSDNPAAAFEAIVEHLCPPPPAPEPGVHPTAAVAEDAQLADGVSIGAHCVVEPGAVIGPRTVLRPLVFVGREARIGAECVLHPHVAVLHHCVLGDRVVLHSGVVVGADGYGYELTDGVHAKIPQRGIAEVGDDVEIGANATVDRARFGRTVIGEGTKIDNLVMVAHNVVIGPHSLLVSQAGIAGSTTLGHHVTLAAQAGLVGHIQVGDGAIIAAQSGVTNDVPPGTAVFGSPAQEIRRGRRAAAIHRNLPELVQRVRSLEQTLERLASKVERLEAHADHHPEDH
ncbi:MAG: UDP-3-O-(3-hydroxymyristoyl)glucosamine N-acyltransferase [Planctomycetota bacterium]